MRLPRVLRPVSRLIGALQGVKSAIRDLCGQLEVLTQAQKDAGPATARLEALELGRHQWEATCEGLLQKAEGKLRAANNAEARERANKKSYAHLIDPLDEIGLEPETPAGNPDRNIDASQRGAEGMPALRVDVAHNNKALAQRAKFGVRNGPR